MLNYQIKSISDSELDILKILWKHEELTAREIYNEFNKLPQLKINTVRTFLSRLVKKDVIAYRRIGSTYIYRSLISPNQLASIEIIRLLKKFNHVGIVDVISCVLREEKLSLIDIGKIKKVFNEIY